MVGFVALGLVTLVLAKRSAGKSISRVTYFVSSGMKNLNWSDLLLPYPTEAWRSICNCHSFSSLVYFALRITGQDGPFAGICCIWCSAVQQLPRRSFSCFLESSLSRGTSSLLWWFVSFLCVHCFWKDVMYLDRCNLEYWHLLWWVMTNDIGWNLSLGGINLVVLSWPFIKLLTITIVVVV